MRAQRRWGDGKLRALVERGKLASLIERVGLHPPCRDVCKLLAARLGGGYWEP